MKTQNINEIANKIQEKHDLLFADTTPAYVGIAEDMRVLNKQVMESRFIQNRLHAGKISYKTALEAFGEISRKAAPSLARVNFWTRKSAT